MREFFAGQIRVAVHAFQIAVNGGFKDFIVDKDRDRPAFSVPGRALVIVTLETIFILNFMLDFFFSFFVRGKNAGRKKKRPRKKQK